MSSLDKMDYPAQKFIHFSAPELNDQYVADDAAGLREIPLPVSGDLTAVTA